MHKRFSIILLLIVSMMTTATSHPFVQDDPSAAQEEAKLKPEDEREARAISIRFVKEFQKTLDFSALTAGEMFVKDLPERIRKQSPNESFYIPIKASVVKQASDEDLLRYFNIMSNACFLYWALVATDEFRRTHLEQQEGCGKETSIEKLVPVEAVNVLSNDPTFGPAIAKQFGIDEKVDEESGDSTQSSEETDEITTLEQLKISASIWEDAASITRKHLNNLPAWQQAKQHIPYFNSELEAADEETVSLEVSKLSEEFLGQRESIICARVLMFHLDLIPVGGHLKILSVSFNDYHLRTREETKKAAQLGELKKAIDSDDMEAFDSLVRAGVDINAKEDDCTAPIIFAALSGRLEMVKALIAVGADVNASNRYGNTALMYAAGDGNEAMTIALLDAGADVNAKNESGSTALDSALRYDLSESHRRVVKLLESHRARQ